MYIYVNNLYQITSAILNIKINRYTKAHATFVMYLGAQRRVNHRQTMLRILDLALLSLI